MSNLIIKTPSILPKTLKKQLLKEGYIDIMLIPNKGICGIMRFLFTYGLVIGLDTTGYKGRYCYKDLVTATMALHMWDGKNDPPLQWIKYKGEGGERSNSNF